MTQNKIHKTAVIAESAKIHPSVEIGAYSVIEEGVTIGADTKIGAHVVIEGPTTIGERNTIYSYAAVGGAPQDLTYKGEPTELIIGSDNRIREYATINRGTIKGGGKTVIGNHCLLMAYTHVAHDCQLGDYVIMANVATLAGHVTVHDHASIGGLVAVHQFCRIGPYSYIGGMSGISKDVPPYMLVSGTRNKTKISKINKVGLRRNNFSKEVIANLDQAFRTIFKTDELLKKDAFELVKKRFPDCEEVLYLVKFMEDSTRGFVQRTSGDE